MNQEDIKSMRVALDNMDDYAKMECSIDPIGAYKVLSAGIDMLESLNNQLTECQRGRDEHNNFIQRNNQVVALYDTPAPSVPEGYVLVPIEPTVNQIVAGQDSGSIENSKRIVRIYKAMLSAARSE